MSDKKSDLFNLYKDNVMLLIGTKRQCFKYFLDRHVMAANPRAMKSFGYHIRRVKS